jgi:hypothetical protein
LTGNRERIEGIAIRKEKQNQDEVGETSKRGDSSVVVWIEGEHEKARRGGKLQYEELIAA